MARGSSQRDGHPPSSSSATDVALATDVARATLEGRDTSISRSGGEVAALTVLYHPRLERIGDRAVLSRLVEDGEVLLSREAPDFAPPGGAPGAPLGDEHLSRRPLRLSPGPGGGLRLDLGDSSTTVSLQGERLSGARSFSAAELQQGVVLELGRRVVLLLHLVASLQRVLGPSTGADAGEPREITGESDGVRRMLWEIRSVADLELPVLLRGETGSGKELVARALHRSSRRRDRPFVAVNLGAISPSLAVAELFGAERGAFTGSVKRQPGYFEQARGGTLFLDEIGEAPVELQVALLRALETGEVQPVGAQEIRKADVRVVAATDADLEAKVSSGAFRAPLLNRLSAYEIWIPPLRERRDDFGRLFARFLREELAEVGEEQRLAPPAGGGRAWLPASVVARLAAYDWPGNVRQLRNVVRQLVVGNRGRDRAEVTPAVERLLSRAAAPLSPPPSPAGAGAPPPPPAAAGAPVLLGAPPPHAAAPPVEAPAEPSPPPLLEERPATAAARSGRRRPADVTEQELGDALRASRFDLAAAAERLGVSRASMYLLIERHPRFRTAGDLTPEEIARSHGECGGDVARMAERLEVSERALLRRVRELGLG
ncbi:sigma 54-interacting transcriptional regulator [Sorangium cellulosum]|uniref:sigma 54-interacting transcriptional regulator n=1 Tax=Sorangium cellulosum TaxID=56 RepID=UPI003D9A1256